MELTPRRARVDHWIGAEHAISDAVNEIEQLGAHEKLTAAVIALADAQRLVADWFDNCTTKEFRTALRAREAAR